MCIGLYTFGLSRHRTGSPTMGTFASALEDVYADAHKAPGFVAQAMDERPDLASTRKIGEDYGRWGRYVVPRLAAKRGMVDELRIVTTLSMWTDIELARRFVYGGAHRQALKRRAEWFLRGDWPSHVMWPLEATAYPTWRTGTEKLDELDRRKEADTRLTFASSCRRESQQKA